MIDHPPLPKRPASAPEPSISEVLENLHRRLARAATDQNGTLSLREIHRILDAAEEELPRPRNLTGLERQRSPKGSPDARQELVGRVLVGRFESLLSPEGVPPTKEAPLPRGIIAPLFRALRMMIGSMSLQQAHETLLEEVNKLQSDSPELSSEKLWEILQHHPATVGLSIQLFSRVAISFADRYTERRDWFVRFINTLLSSLDTPRLVDDEPRWSFSNRHCVAVLQGLSSDTRALLAQPDGAKRLETELGVTNVSALNYLLKSLDQDA